MGVSKAEVWEEQLLGRRAEAQEPVSGEFLLMVPFFLSCFYTMIFA